VITYRIRIPSIVSNNCNGGTTNPSIVAKGMKGNNNVMTKAIALRISKNFPGILLINDLCVRTTNKISSSVEIDSMNQPV